MLRRVLLLIFVAAVATPLLAQPTGDLVPLTAGQIALNALEEEFRAAQNEYYRRYAEAKSDEEREKVILDPSKDPVPIFASRYVDLAREHAGSAAAVEAWMWVFQVAGRSPRSDEHVREAIDTLLESYRDHVSLPEHVRFAFYAGNSPPTVRLLEGLWQRSARDETRAAAGYGLARLALSGRVATTESQERARALYEELRSKYGDLAFHGELSYRTQIERDLFELENLWVGKVAPEITGEDIGGTQFSLSDYRGKVVMLDFWGDW